MKNLVLTLWILLTYFTVCAQGVVEVDFVDSVKHQDEIPISYDSFGTVYILKGPQIIKKGAGPTLFYSNVQLGDIGTADIFNPLKINLFYPDFNTVIILDNRLAEITKIDFNLISPLRLVTHVSAGNDNTIWIFDQNTLQLELYDYILNKKRVTTLPLQGNILDMDSDYNNCYVLTDKEILRYNYFGSLINRIPNPGFTDIEIMRDKLFLRNENTLAIVQDFKGEISEIAIPELLISRFFVTEETLYIYDGERLHQYHLKTD